MKLNGTNLSARDSHEGFVQWYPVTYYTHSKIMISYIFPAVHACIILHRYEVLTMALYQLENVHGIWSHYHHHNLYFIRTSVMLWLHYAYVRVYHYSHIAFEQLYEQNYGGNILMSLCSDEYFIITVVTTRLTTRRTTTPVITMATTTPTIVTTTPTVATTTQTPTPRLPPEFGGNNSMSHYENTDKCKCSSCITCDILAMWCTLLFSREISCLFGQSIVCILWRKIKIKYAPHQAVIFAPNKTRSRYKVKNDAYLSRITLRLKPNHFRIFKR